MYAMVCMDMEYVSLLKRNIEYNKNTLAWEIYTMIGCKQIGHFINFSCYRELSFMP